MPLNGEMLNFTIFRFMLNSVNYNKILIIIQNILIIFLCSLHVLALVQPIGGQDETIVILYTKLLWELGTNFIEINSVYPWSLSLYLLPFELIFSQTFIFSRIFLMLGFLIILLNFYKFNFSILGDKRSFTIGLLILFYPGISLYWKYSFILFCISVFLLVKHKTIQNYAWLFAYGTCIAIRPEFLVMLISGLVLIFVKTLILKNYKKYLKRTFNLFITLMLSLSPLIAYYYLIIVQGNLDTYAVLQLNIRKGRYIDSPYLPVVVLFLFLFLLIVIIKLKLYLARTYIIMENLSTFLIGQLIGSIILSIILINQRFTTLSIRQSLLLMVVSASAAYLSTRAISGQNISTNRVVSGGGKRSRKIVITLVIAGACMVLFSLITKMNSYLDNGFSLVCKDGRDCISLNEEDYLTLNRVRSTLPSNSLTKIFVGTIDLGNPSYSENWLYLMTNFSYCSNEFELNPGSSNFFQKEFQSDLNNCNFLILSNKWENIYDNYFSFQLSQKSSNNKFLNNNFSILKKYNNFTIYKRNNTHVYQ